MSKEAFTVRTESKKIEQLDRLADRMDRSRNYMVNQAIDGLLEVYEWQTERVRDGVRAANEGRFASEARMKRIFNKYEKA
ncbi:MAG: CopG family ribbon-helix-helix protein [Thermodesulfobacteriota bacterium]